ncbi:hypothetical protein ACJJIG_21110 [Microbulbifer sp. SSSA007]|uniref:hypothetical protein n=1 Tax=Microbulbifer sp. SSSA007 TaxID=3243379 RepID=UPI0040395F0C
MRIFKGFLKTGACFIALTGCQEGMKGSEIYPTADNLIEIEPDRLKIIEARSITGGVLIIVGESSSRRCEIKVAGVTLQDGFSISSIEESSRIRAQCKWQGHKYIQVEKYLTPVALNIKEDATIDIQVFSLESKQYLAITAIDLQLPATTNKY